MFLFGLFTIFKRLGVYADKNAKNGISQLASQAPALINLENLSTYIGQPPGAWPVLRDGEILIET